MHDRHASGCTFASLQHRNVIPPAAFDDIVRTLNLQRCIFFRNCGHDQAPRSGPTQTHLSPWQRRPQRVVTDGQGPHADTRRGYRARCAACTRTIEQEDEQPIAQALPVAVTASSRRSDACRSAALEAPGHRTSARTPGGARRKAGATTTKAARMPKPRSSAPDGPERQTEKSPEWGSFLFKPWADYSSSRSGPC